MNNPLNPKEINFGEPQKKSSPIKKIILIIFLAVLGFFLYEIFIHKEWLQIAVGMTLFITFLLGSWAINRFMPEGGSASRSIVVWVLISLLFSGLWGLWKVINHKITPEKPAQEEKTFEEQMEDYEKVQDILKDYKIENLE